MRLIATFLAFLFVSLPVLALAPDWLENYTLSATQIRILTNWAEKGTFSDEKLIALAQKLHENNLKPKPYVPPHTFAELNEVMHWAQGGAFATFAQFAGFSFDNKDYNADCPNRVLFNFGMATGTTYLQLDVMMLTGQTFGSLQMMYSHHPDTFPEKFLQLATSRGFDIYLEPQPTLQASLE